MRTMILPMFLACASSMMSKASVEMHGNDTHLLHLLVRLYNVLPVENLSEDSKGQRLGSA